LSDLRDTIKDEFDDGMLPPGEFFCQVSGVRISQKQEQRLNAWEMILVNRGTISPQPKKQPRSTDQAEICTKNIRTEESVTPLVGSEATSDDQEVDPVTTTAGAITRQDATVPENSAAKNGSTFVSRHDDHYDPAPRFGSTQHNAMAICQQGDFQTKKREIALSGLSKVAGNKTFDLLLCHWKKPLDSLRYPVRCFCWPRFWISCAETTR
jgi:hypothetical protein